MSRIRNSIRNASISLLSQFIILAMQVYTRRLFIKYLSIDYLGCNSLFSNIFSCMAIFEANSGALFSYMMYQAIANKDNKKICKILQLNKIYNWIMGGIIVLLTIPIYFFLPQLVKNTTNFSWSFLRMIFLLYLVKVELGLVFGYFQLVFDTHQRNYVCSFGNAVKNIIVGITQIVAIVVFRSYVTYLIVELAGYFLYYLFIRVYAKQQYRYLKEKTRIDREFIRETGIFGEIKNGIVHKVAHTIYGGTDSLVISAFLGLRDNALYSNYLLLRTQVVTLFSDKIMNSMAASIGNYIYDDQKSGDNKKMFYTLDILGYLMASFCAFSFCLLCEPFICVIWGDNLLLGKGCLFAEAILIYLSVVSSPWSMFRNSYGNYKIDRNLVLMSAIVNVAMSLILVKYFGIIGILIGTAFGDLFQIAGYLKVVFLMQQDIQKKKFVLKQITRGLGTIVEIIAAYYACSIFLKNDLWGLVIRTVACVFIPNIINLILFGKREECIALKRYILQIVKRKG